MKTIFVRIGKQLCKVQVNPWTTPDDERYARLCDAYVRQMRRGQIASAIRIERQIVKFEKEMEANKKRNPLTMSKSKRSVGKNISWLMRHPKELTAKTKPMRRKQAIAIAMSIFRRSQKKGKS